MHIPPLLDQPPGPTVAGKAAGPVSAEGPRPGFGTGGARDSDPTVATTGAGLGQIDPEAWSRPGDPMAAGRDGTGDVCRPGPVGAEPPNSAAPGSGARRGQPARHRGVGPASAEASFSAVVAAALAPSLGAIAAVPSLPGGPRDGAPSASGDTASAETTVPAAALRAVASGVAGWLDTATPAGASAAALAGRTDAFLVAPSPGRRPATEEAARTATAIGPFAGDESTVAGSPPEQRGVDALGQTLVQTLVPNKRTRGEGMVAVVAGRTGWIPGATGPASGGDVGSSPSPGPAAPNPTPGPSNVVDPLVPSFEAPPLATVAERNDPSIATSVAATVATATAPGRGDPRPPGAGPGDRTERQHPPTSPARFRIEDGLSSLGSLVAARDPNRLEAAHELPSTEPPRPAPTPGDVERLFGLLAARIRQASRDGLPTLEATFHDPALGNVRLAVRGLPEGPIEAVLVVTSESAARAIEQVSRDPAIRLGDLGVLDLQVRIEPGTPHGAAADVRGDARAGPGHPGPGHPGQREGSGQALVDGDRPGHHDPSARHGTGRDAPEDGGRAHPAEPLAGLGVAVRVRRQGGGPRPSPATAPAAPRLTPRLPAGIDLRL